MKKMIIILIIMVILGTICWTYFLNTAEKEIKKITNKIEAKLGKKVIVGKDTLQITDYSFIHQNYTLSNGKTISFALADSLQVK